LIGSSYFRASVPNAGENVKVNFDVEKKLTKKTQEEKRVRTTGPKFMGRSITMARTLNIIFMLAAVLGLAACGKKESATDRAKEKATAEAVAEEKEALETAIEVYIYAYPLVTMEYTRRALTNAAASEGFKAPMGQFVRMKEYSGANKYLMHFNKGEMPPVEGFWSLTMYNGEFFFVDNPLNRYNVSSRSKFKANADGSVDIYIQNESPGEDKEANWLPAAKEKFILMLRMYWPKEKTPSIIDGTWKIPAVKQAS